MIKIAIVEDDIKFSNTLKELIKQYGDESKIVFDVHKFSNAEMFLDKFKSDYDIILLDISLPGIDGIETANKIRKCDEIVSIIFITSLAQYALCGYKVSAKDYFVKPISYLELKMCFDRIIPSINKDKMNKSIKINLKKNVKKVELDNIYYIESFGHMIIYHTVDGDISVRGDPIKTIEKELAPYGFACCASYYLVNLKYCDYIEGDTLVLNNKTIKISRTKKKQFIEKLSNYFSMNNIKSK